MSNIKSSKKDVSISKKRRLTNTSRKSMIKTFIKKVYLAIAMKNRKFALETFKKLQVILDRYSTKGIIHKNKAARHKSNLYLKIMKVE